jgi:hypothetical protein
MSDNAAMIVIALACYALIFGIVYWIRKHE